MELLKNTKEVFENICSTYQSYDEMYNFYTRLSKIVPKDIDADNLILAYKLTLGDYEEVFHTATHFFTNIPEQIRPYVSDEFYIELWERYNRDILGVKLPHVSQGNYSCIEVEPEVIDISMKDKNQVLAALYNSSAPVGMGFAQYKPEPWNEEYAELAFQHMGRDLGDGSIFFDWVLGRPLRCTFKDNLVYVRAYNGNNAPRLAERVISNVPDIYQKENAPQKIKNKKEN